MVAILSIVPLSYRAVEIRTEHTKNGLLGMCIGHTAVS